MIVSGGWSWTLHSPTGSGPEGSSPNEFRRGSHSQPPTFFHFTTDSCGTRACVGALHWQRLAFRSPYGWSVCSILPHSEAGRMASEERAARSGRASQGPKRSAARETYLHFPLAQSIPSKLILWRQSLSLSLHLFQTAICAVRQAIQTGQISGSHE